LVPASTRHRAGGLPCDISRAAGTAARFRHNSRTRGMCISRPCIACSIRRDGEQRDQHRSSDSGSIGFCSSGTLA
jgi:hypothetical protein